MARIASAQMKGLAKTLELFRELDPTLPSQVIAVFLEIANAEDGELETRDLPDRVGLAQSSVNRALTYLSDRHWSDKDKPGLQLIEHRLHPLDRRQRIAVLSPKGKTFVRKIEEYLS